MEGLVAMALEAAVYVLQVACGRRRRTPTPDVVVRRTARV